MKNQRTMYMLAKAAAIANGPVRISAGGKNQIGYCIPVSFLETLYTKNGFLKKTALRHLETWTDLRTVQQVQTDGGRKIIFFILDDEDAAQDAELRYFASQERLPDDVVYSIGGAAA